MPKRQLPDIEAIRTLPGTLRFLAAVGAAVSLSASLELLYFDLFVEAKDGDAESLAGPFYCHVNGEGKSFKTKASKRRKSMNGAVLPTLSVSGREEWSLLLARLEKWTGDDSLRHFVAHTPVTLVEGGFSDDFSADDFEVDEFVAIQDSLQAMANGVNARIEDFDSTLAYCGELESIYTDLLQFLVRYQAGER